MGRRSAGSHSLGRPSTRSWIHELDWIFIIFAAGVTFYLGYKGLAEAAPDDQALKDPGLDPEEEALADPANRAYDTLQLFFLDSPPVAEPSTELTIARFAAPLVAGVATVRAIMAFFSERAQLFHARYRARGHAVVVGLGSKGFHLARALDRDDRSVVVIERDAATPEIRGCRERGIPVVIGDATDHVVLEKAGLARAAHLVTVCGDDGTNVNVVFAAQASTGPGRGKPLEALVHIDDPDLRGVLQARAIELWSRSTVLLECFNVFEDAAPMILEEHPFDAAVVDDGSPEIAVVGVGRLGQALATLAAQRWHDDRSARRKALGITLMGPDASQRCAALRTQTPELSEGIALRGEDIEIPPLDLQEHVVALGQGQPTIVYVTAALETDELTTACALHRTYGDTGTPIVVAVRDDRSGVATTLEKAEMTGLHDVRPFALFSSTLTPDLLRRRTRDIIARLRHTQYLRDELGKGRKLGERPSLVPWAQLDPRLKASNLDFADRIGATIEDAGCTLVPRPLTARADSFSFSRDRLEELAEKEHERWCLAEAPRNPDHPSLVPWSQLPEEEKEKDREAVKTIPELVARAGFEMRRNNRIQRTTSGRRSVPDRVADIDEASALAEGSFPAARGQGREGR